MDVAIHSFENLLRKIHNSSIHLGILSEVLIYYDSHSQIWNKKISTCNILQNQIESYFQEIEQCSFRKFGSKFAAKRILKRLRRKTKFGSKTKKHPTEIIKSQSTIQFYNRITEDTVQLKDDFDKQTLTRKADIVLADVRSNIVDVRKRFSLLKEIEKLRSMRAIAAKREYIAPEAAQVFQNIIEKLSQPWAALNREYHLEEKGLKLMIKSNKNNISSLKRDVFCAWRRMIFGSSPLFKPNLQTSIALRIIWDGYIDVNEGTRTPLDWISPCLPVAKTWMKYHCINDKIIHSQD